MTSVPFRFLLLNLFLETERSRNILEQGVSRIIAYQRSPCDVARFFLKAYG